MNDAAKTLAEISRPVNFTSKQLRNFWKKVDKNRIGTGCWHWIGSRGKSGYGHFKFNEKTKRAHRISWEIVNGEIPHGFDILHKCDTPPCVNPSHLRIGTKSDNSQDREDKGRGGDMNGENNGFCKLTRNKVIAIRQEYALGTTTSRRLAKSFGVSKTTILRIINKKNWVHI